MTKYLFQIVGSNTYENPYKETLESYLTRKGLTTEEEAIERLNGLGLIYFIGTEAEYKALNELEPWKYWEEKDGTWATFDPTGSHKYAYLKDGKYVGFQLPDGATEKTEAEYKVWDTANNLKLDFINNLRNLKEHSSPKLAAYILKCEEYIAIHNGAVKADALTTFIGTNGKLDIAKLKTQIKANNDKRDSILVLGEVYLTWIKAIEDGTQASLDTLPDSTPNELNRTIDSVWKAEHDKERAEAIKVFHSSEAAFKIVDKYNQVSLSDEPEIDND